MSHKLQAIDPAERAKILKLQSEKSDSGADKKVEWLYSGDKIDKDAYLLGKPIDKLLIEKEIEKPKEANPYAAVDLESKIREDPLFEIKKREIEAKKRLLENPLRMKQLQEMITQKSSKSDRGRHDSDNSDEDERRHKGRRHDDDRQRHQRHRRSSSSDDERSHKSKKKHKKRSRSRSSSREDRRHKSESSRNRPSAASYTSSSGSGSRTYGLEDRRGGDRHRNPSPPTRSDGQPKSKAHAEIEEYKARIDKLKQIRGSGSSAGSSGGGADRRGGPPARMSEEERQRKLREMQDNAKWRDDVRNKNVSKYQSEEKREDDAQEASKSSDSKAEASSFFNSMMRDAYVSAEDRIKRNMRNVQRGDAAFDRNFARK